MCLCAVLFAQGTGSIVGTVTDPSGAVIADCRVTVVEVATGFARTGSCGPNGYYVVPSLRPTTYNISIDASGFSPFQQKDATLLANQALTVNAKLQLSATSQSITVETAPAQVDTTTPTLGEVVDQARIQELPLNGRNAAQLTTLVAGAVTAPDARSTQGLTFPVNVPISANGARNNQISYNLDGGNNTDGLTNVNAPFPFPDALQEFSVQTSNYSAQFGQNAGAVVNIVTKSGTNQLHGAAFGFVRNAALNARSFFEAQRDQLKRDQYGFTLGGPVRLPGYNGRDRTFFFVGYQGTRISNVTTAQSATVPVTPFVNGDFSALLDPNNPANTQGRIVQLKDPLTGQPFAGNLIPTSRYDPASLKVLNYLPAPTATGLVFYSMPFRQDFGEIVTKIDQKLTEKDQLSGRYFFDKFTQQGSYTGNNILTLAGGKQIPTQNALLHETHVFRPNLLNDARFTYSRLNGANGPPDGMVSVSDFGVKLNQDPTPKTIGGIGVTGFIYVSGGWPVVWVRNTFEGSDDVQWIHGKHTISMGARIQRARFDNTNTYQQRPDFTFSGDYTGYAPADFLLGKVRNFNQAAGQFLNVRTTHAGVYFQDRMHLSTRLTVDVGIRYEPMIPWNEIRDRVMMFVPDNYYAGVRSQMFPNAPAGLLFPGDSGFTPHGVNGDYNNFAPRAGFAYDVFGNGKTSLRGGAGVFYDSNQVMAANIPFVTNPFIYQLSITDLKGPFSDPYRGMVDPFPAPPPSKSAVFPNPTVGMTYDPYASKYITPVSYNWNLAVEQQLAQDWMARLAYVGSHGSHVFEIQQLNPAMYIPNSSAGTDARRIYQGYGNISSIAHDVNSSYNSLQATLQRRFSHGLTVLANYTFAKSIDNLPVGAAVNSALVPPALPFYNPNFHALDRGPSEFDRTHVFVASYVWQTPAFSKSNRLVRYMLGTWEMTGIISAQTGQAFTIAAGQDRSKTGIGGDRGVLTGASMYGSGACGSQAPCVDYLNRSAFALPDLGTFGSIGKGALRGPGLFNWDMGLFKTIPVYERLKIQLRGEFFNVLNHTNFGLPSNSVSSGSFGRILSANSPRIGQVGLKVTF